MLPLIPGLGLILETGAPEIVHRVAADIFRRYGRG
jgi:hypothetical protein